MEKGILLDKETVGLLENLPDPVIEEFIDKISVNFNEKVITRSFFDKNLQKIKEIFLDKTTIIEKISLKLGISVEIKKEVEIREKVIKENKIVNSLSGVKLLSSHHLINKQIEVDDFTRYFRNRFNDIRRILQDRTELANLTSLNRVSGQRQNISIIAAVFNKRVTKNKNLILEVEDLTGRANLLVNANKPELFQKANELLLDDIVGFKCTGTREMLFVNDIVFPDAALPSKKRSEQDVSIAFTSDIHVGSNMFLEESFVKFIDWLNGNVGDDEQKKEALRVKYLFIIGDSIDGVGVYPGQENLLTIRDISLQYVKLAELLKSIRKDVKIILCPGQHDSVRVAEPQPVIGRDYGAALYELDNLLLVSNPAIVEIEGFKILMYHGASMINIVHEIDELRLCKAQDTPTKVIKHMLRRRHLAPSHSLVTYIPAIKDDPLMIKEVPDIITTGDLHRADVDVYNNILAVSSSCWQSLTPFEEKVGNHPDPCKVPILNLKTRAIKILDFSEGEK